MKITINREESTPVYRQIFRQIRAMILSGQLPTGFRLPPERRLATALGVTRTTVISAYDELKSEGLVDARVGRGTVVLAAKQPFPDTDPGRMIVWSHYFRDEGLRSPDPLVRNLLETSMQPNVISLAIGLPSPEHVPVQLVRDMVSDLAREAGPHLLLQTPTEGHLPLRETLARWLTTRGIVCSVEDLLILSGSQQGLHLAARVFLNPGDTVIVEAPTYFGAMEAFRRAGVRLIAVPVDDDGMRVDELAALLRHHRPKLIYTLPTFQNPSGVVLSLDRRRQLLQLAGSYGIPILEDDTYTELRYDGVPVPSLKAMDTQGLVLSLGTFSKMLFPGLRLGWLVAPRPVIRQFALAKQTEDLHASTLGQWILERIIREGHLDTHLQKMRSVYRVHRDTMQKALSANSIEEMRWQTPMGGFYFWCELPRTVDRAQLSTTATEEGVNYLPGYPCFVEEPPAPLIRLSFSFSSPEEIAEGSARLLRAIRKSMGRGDRTREVRHTSTRPLV